MNDVPSVVDLWLVTFLLTLAGSWSLGCALAALFPGLFSLWSRVVLSGVAGAASSVFWAYLFERLTDAERFDYLSSHPGAGGFISIDPPSWMSWSFLAAALGVVGFRGSRRAWKPLAAAGDGEASTTSTTSRQATGRNGEATGEP